MIYLQIFIEFFKTGLFAIGGGLATLPFLRDISERLEWFTTGELVDMLAVSSSVPGPMGVNLAAYAGFATAGALGGVVAAIGIVTPSIIIILIIARVLKSFGENRIIENTFKVLRPAAAGLIMSAALSIMLLAVFPPDNNEGIRLLPIILYVVLTALCFFGEYNKIERLRNFKPHPLLFIATGAVVGMAFGKYL